MSTQEPFIATTTPAIERANRLISLKDHPGFLDVLRISQQMVNDAVQVCINYGGWDPQQIMVLKVRMQCAQEHHNALIARIQEAIQEGIREAKEREEAAKIAQQPTLTPAEVIERGDYVRQKVMEKFNDMDNRVAGSF